MRGRLAITLAVVLAATGSGREAVTQDAQCTVAGQPVQGRQLLPPCYVFSADIPADIVTQDVGAIGFQPFVDILAWDTFIALNWPAPNPIAERGVPDRQNLIGGLVTKGEGGTKALAPGPTVWETFKDSDDIYLNPPNPPSPFDAPESIPAACRQLAAGMPRAALRTMTRTAKISEVLRNVQQADGNRLVDQNGQNVWYEVKLNRVYYDYVVKNKFYVSTNQQNKTILFPWSSNVTSQPATVKVKAAWKVMGLLGSKQPDDPTKFYTIEALVIDPTTGACAKRLLGLVGLHVVAKTALLPQWLWATFEHVDNAPDQATGPVPGRQYNFYSAACPNCPVNTPPGTGQNNPTQVVRVTPVASEAIPDNTAYHTALKTLRADNVWQNYMLVDAQWAGSRTNIGVPTQPKFLANTTLETYLQAMVQPDGCINCHGMYAAKQDLDFQLQNAYPRTAKRFLDLFRVPGVANGTKSQ